MTPTVLLGYAAALGLTAGGVLLLRRAWRAPRPAGPTVGGWALLALATLGWAAGAGWDKATALALLAPSLVVAPALAANVKIRRGRADRPVRGEVELEVAPARAWRTVARTLCAGPLAGAAALALGAAVVLRAPIAAPDRLVAAGLLTPMLWGAGLIWATTDPRILRIAGGLAVMAVVGGWAAR